MKSKYLLKDPLPWMLESSDPALRYLTKRDILHEGSIDYESILSDNRIRQLFKSSSSGVLGDTAAFDLYYRGTMWVFAESIEHGLDMRTPEIKKTSEYILNEFQTESGGFTLRWKPRIAVSCRTGDMIRHLVLSGSTDSRINKGIEWIVANQRHDGGWLHCPLTNYTDFILLLLFNRAGKFHNREKDTTVKSCFYGTYACINALLTSPNKSDKIQGAIQRGIDFILNHRIYKSSDNAPLHPRFGWNKDFRLLGYPVLSQFDFLYGLLIAAKAGCINDPRTGEAFNLLMSKQNHDGTWNLESLETGMMHGGMGKKSLGKPNKWVTLNALRLLSNMP